MPEEKTIKEQLDEIVQKLDEQKDKKKFKLPWSIRMKKGKFRKNYAIIQIVRMNGSVEFKVVKIEDNTIKVGDVYHDASADYILRYKKYPLIILPEWNITPFSPRQNLKEAVEEGKLTSTEKFILARMKMDTVKPGLRLNFATILIVLAVAGAALLLLDYLQVI